ncbi:MAG: hypothetical protein QOF58_3988 [Pseudonocardiales bacterium]|jgi:hypothetical protein|nr:hypothetical protein [Pseudonocardiales bacterium]
MSYVAPPPGTTVEIRRTQAHSVQFAFERGVILASTIGWIIVYFPGTLDRLADPADPTSIRGLDTANVTYRELVDCDPAWVVSTWKRLEQAGFGLLKGLEALRIWKLAATIAQHHLDSGATQLITRAQWESWAGRPLTDDDLARLRTAIPHSTIPDAVGTIVSGLDERDTARAAQ